MGKKFLISVAMCGLISLIVIGGKVTPGIASDFSSTIDWPLTSTGTYIEIDENFEWFQTIIFNFPVKDVTSADFSADLALTHSGNAANDSNGAKAEIWTLDGNGNKSTISEALSASGGGSWTTDHFDIKSLFTGLSGDSITLYFKLSELTAYVSPSEQHEPVINSIKLDSSKITGTYTAAAPVPIPGAAVLLGSGLLGLIGIGSRKKKA